MFKLEEYLQIVHNMPKIVQAQLKSKDCCVAGGYIRDSLLGLTPSDLDIFCHSKEVAEQLANQVNQGYGITESNYSLTILVEGIKVQYIYCRPWTTVQSLIDQFDFTCCGVGIYWTIGDVDPCWKISTVDNFEKDTKDMMLIFRCADYNKGNLGALTRAFRFTAKGWYLPQSEMAKIIHHYVAYAPELRAIREYTSIDLSSLSLEPNIDLSIVQRAVNPTYNTGNRRE